MNQELRKAGKEEINWQDRLQVEKSMIEAAVNQVYRELVEAREKFPAFSNGHEGYAVILEELDEVWSAIKANDIEHARVEAKQVAAMAIRFMLDLAP